MLKELINQFFLDNRKEKKRTHFYISDAGKCHRQIFFSFKKSPKKKMAANFLRLFEHGNHMHQMLTETLSRIKSIKIVAVEVDIPRQKTISGRIDAIIEVEGELYVVDFKSMNSMTFNKMKEPKEENIRQLQLYLHYFKIKNGILLYINKDNLMLKEYIVYENPVAVKKMLDELDDLKEQIDSNTLPARLKDYPKEWRCKYCNYRKICRKE